MQTLLPFGRTKLWLGILAIIFAPVAVGFIFGLIAVFLKDKDKRMYQRFPNTYSDSALKQHKTGSQWAIAGGIISTLFLIAIVYCFYQYGTANPWRVIEILQ